MTLRTFPFVGIRPCALSTGLKLEQELISEIVPISSQDLLFGVDIPLFKTLLQQPLKFIGRSRLIRRKFVKKLRYI